MNKKNEFFRIVVIIIFTMAFNFCSENLSEIDSQSSDKDNVTGILYGALVPDNGAFESGFVSASVHWVNSYYYYQISGIAYADSINPTPVLAGDITASDITIEPNSYHNSMYGYATLPSEELTPVFGDTSEWGFSGNQQTGIPSFSTDMYSIGKIALNNAAAPGTEISKSNNLSLSWDSDDGNDEIVIVVVYDAMASNRLDTSLPDDDIEWQTTTPDDGSYTLHSSVFSDMPVTGLVHIAIGRVNSVLYMEDSKNFRLISLATARTQYFLDE